MAPRADQAQRDPATRSTLSSLQKRILSAAILLPVAVAALWLGDLVWAALIFIFAVVMAWEWCAISEMRRQPQIPYATGHLSLISAIMLATVVMALFPAINPTSMRLPPSWISLSIGFVFSVASAWPKRGLAALWTGLGLLYVVPASLAALRIRAEAGDGLSTEIWIVALVVAADTGAYVAGRSIGGPKLAPRISPSKTWAGLGGAIVSAAIVGWLTGLIVPVQAPWLLSLISGGLAVVEQAGDLFESFFKRHFGVKDSGRIIPGHGGVLDRVDGLLAVILTVAGLELLMGGGIFRWL